MFMRRVCCLNKRPPEVSVVSTVEDLLAFYVLKSFKTERMINVIITFIYSIAIFCI